MSEKPLHAVLQGIADEGIPPEKVDLWPRIRDGLDKNRLVRRSPFPGCRRELPFPCSSCWSC